MVCDMTITQCYGISDMVISVMVLWTHISLMSSDITYHWCHQWCGHQCYGWCTQDTDRHTRSHQVGLVSRGQSTLWHLAQVTLRRANVKAHIIKSTHHQRHTSSSWCCFEMSKHTSSKAHIIKGTHHQRCQSTRHHQHWDVLNDHTQNDHRHVYTSCLQMSYTNAYHHFHFTQNDHRHLYDICHIQMPMIIVKWS